ncbi:MAG: 3'-5' exoribonuclease YhaM family protein [Acidobacteriota bacterium]
MNRLPRISEIVPESVGWGFFLCARKELRSGRNGDFLTLMLQDNTGQVVAKIFQDVDTLRHEFDAGEFVKVVGRGGIYHQRLELILDKIRRVHDPDRHDGFREEDCIPCAPRPIDDMWRELMEVVAREATNPWVRALLDRALARYGERMRIWPAAQLVHHAYRGGLLEHVLKMSEVGVSLAKLYGADSSVVLAGVLLHDIGKLEELEYECVTRYSTAGNLLGHITLGAQAVSRLADSIEGFPADLEIEIAHLVLSHHGSREFGSPVEPMTVEAFILAAVDDLDAKIHQVRRHVAEDEGEGAFTGYHPRLKRVLFKPSGR